MIQMYHPNSLDLYATELKDSICAVDLRVLIKVLYILDGVFKGIGGEGHSHCYS